MAHRFKVWSVLILVLVAGFYVSREVWLGWMGHFLVETDPLEPADIAVVLAGDGTGARLLKAVELVKEGYASRVLISGPMQAYGVRESELAMTFAERRGLCTEILEPFPADVTSTLEEVLEVDEELRQRGVRKAIVVTSNYHTRRAQHIFEKYSSEEVDYIFVGTDHPHFDPDSWWKTRDGKETLIIEYIKTLNSWFE